MFYSFMCTDMCEFRKISLFLSSCWMASFNLNSHLLAKLCHLPRVNTSYSPFQPTLPPPLMCNLQVREVVDRVYYCTVGTHYSCGRQSLECTTQQWEHCSSGRQSLGCTTEQWEHYSSGRQSLGCTTEQWEHYSCGRQSLGCTTEQWEHYSKLRCPNGSQFYARFRMPASNIITYMI